MRLLLIPGLIISLRIVAQNVEVITLENCQKMARENHPYFLDKERLKENSKLKYDNINTQWLPQLNVAGQATYQSDAIELSMPVPNQAGGFTQKKIETAKDQFKVTFDVNQLLYDGGSVRSQKNLNESALKAEMFQNEADLNKVTEQLNQTYFALIIYKENIRLIENLRQTLVERQKTIESGYKNGILQESDLDNIKIELLKNQQQITDLKTGYSSIVNVLNELTGKQFGDSLKLELPVVAIPESNTILKPELQMLEAQQEVLNNSDNLYKSNRVPKVFAFSQAGYGKPGLNMLSNEFGPYYMIGVTLKWNIWDWNKTSHDRQSLAIQRDMIGSKRMAIERNFKISANNSISKVRQLESALYTDSLIVDLRKMVSERSARKLEQGVITSTDYITDINAEIQATIQLETHKIQLVQEKVNYLTIVGK